MKAIEIAGMQIFDPSGDGRNGCVVSVYTVWGKELMTQDNWKHNYYILQVMEY